MDQYINVTKTIEKLKSGIINYNLSEPEIKLIENNIRFLKAQPIEDVCPVTRCNKCRYFYWEQDPCHGRVKHYCSILGINVFPDFYCYYGLPKIKKSKNN